MHPGKATQRDSGLGTNHCLLIFVGPLFPSLVPVCCLPAPGKRPHYMAFYSGTCYRQLKDQRVSKGWLQRKASFLLVSFSFLLVITCCNARMAANGQRSWSTTRLMDGALNLL